MFYSISKNGDFREIQFTAGTVTSINEKTIKVAGEGELPITLLEISGDDNAIAFFEFVSDKSVTDVEWSHGKVGEEGAGENIVGTMHKPDKTAVGDYISRNQSSGDLRELNHNHPRGTYPSDVDIRNASSYQERHPNIRLNVFVSGHGYYPYNSNTSPHRSGLRVASSLSQMPSLPPPILIP